MIKFEMLHFGVGKLSESQDRVEGFGNHNLRIQSFTQFTRAINL